jgi:hypothetical protein
VAVRRKMRVGQETMVVKSALALNLNKFEYESKLPADGRKEMEIPYNMLAAMYKLKLDQKIPLIHRADTKNKLFKDVDELGDDIQLRGVFAAIGKDAYKGIKALEIDLAERPAELHLTACFSSVMRLPPFDYKTIGGYCYLDIRKAQNIMYYAELNMYLVPLAALTTQMVIITGNYDKERPLNEIVCEALKKTREIPYKAFD